MSDLTRVPKAHVENVSAIADFAELECLRRTDGNVSALDITRIIVRETDPSGEDGVAQRVSEAFNELAERSEHCGPNDGRYPYEVERGTLLRLRSLNSDNGDSCPPATLYFYLLLATHMNMKTHRKQGGEDGAALFEHLCSEVAIRLWGGGSEEASIGAYVFGTGRETEDLADHELLDAGKFATRVNLLCKSLGEGLGFHSASGSRVTARDGRLDVVVWRRFADGRPGQLIGFGQCKTGTHWDRDLTRLRPEDFFAKWTRKPPAVIPVRLYFVADRVVDRWYDHCVDGGILLDRCRIIEHCNDLSAPLISRVGKWVKAAAASQGLPLP